MSSLTIVMYHYVRKIQGSEFSNIKGLELEGFRRQLDYLQNRYEIVSTEQVITSIKGGSQLPKQACWLTFDDGYKDHFFNVAPELRKRNLSGAFFIPSVPVLENKILDVNAIHFILDRAPNINILIDDLHNLCLKNNLSENQLESYRINYEMISG